MKKITNKKPASKHLADKITLPFIPIKGMVMLPFTKNFFFVGRPKSIDSLKISLAKDKLIFLVSQKKASENNPKETGLFKTGVIGRILSSSSFQKNYKVSFEGIGAAKVLNYKSTDKQNMVEVEKVEFKKDAKEKEYLASISPLIVEQFKEYLSHTGSSTKIIANINHIPAEICYKIIDVLDLPTVKKQKILEINNLKELLDETYGLLVRHNETQKIVSGIHDRITKQITRNQREQILAEQMRMIQKELGKTESDDSSKKLEKKLKDTGMHKEAFEAGKKEIKKLKQMTQYSSEASLVRNYLECLIELPWKKQTKDNIDLKNVKKTLDDDHYGLIEAKEHILDFMGVSARIGEVKAPIICFNGPPGVGKTSLAKSIAKALKRNFVRISVGGLKDEAEIRGHRRTYIGAMPGKIINAMKKAKSINPVILIDEIDKMSTSNMGSPSSALLEALDKEQNNRFHDHYLEVGYDLSKVMFICTSNEIFRVEHALRDRMEVIDLNGYSETEKRHIFKHSLLPKQIKEVGLQEHSLTINIDAIDDMIQNYTKESGVRQLERILGKFLRKLNRQLLDNKIIKKVDINKAMVRTYLKSPRVDWHKIEKTPQIGVVNGLSWSILGGDILVIESLLVKGKGRLIITGKLGDVMKESAQAALSFIKSNAKLLGVEHNKLKDNDFHIHATEAAVNKEGPSAGSALVIALLSALTEIPIRNDVAMTGEITIRGRILPIGGLKEKLLAALRNGVKEVFIPYDNLEQVKDFEKDVKNDLKKLTITAVTNMYSLISKTLISMPGSLKEELPKKAMPKKPPSFGEMVNH